MDVAGRRERDCGEARAHGAAPSAGSGGAARVGAGACRRRPCPWRMRTRRRGGSRPRTLGEVREVYVGGPTLPSPLLVVLVHDPAASFLTAKQRRWQWRRCCDGVAGWGGGQAFTRNEY
jgi:hypothetical protein